MKPYYENRNYDSKIKIHASIVKNLSFVAHWHTDIEMIYVVEGMLGVGINSEYRILQKGELSICSSNDVHYYDSKNMTSSAIMIIFRADILNTLKYWPENHIPSSLFIDQKYMSDQKASSKIQDVIKKILNRIVNEMTDKQAFYPTFSELKLVELFMTIFRTFPAYYADSKKASGNYQSSDNITSMQRALNYIEANYTQDITLEQISQEISLSCSYLSHLFKKTTGMSFSIYMTRIRIEKAAALIKTTKKPIIDIAYETGFRSIRTFNRSFKEVVGITPKSLRQYPLL